MKLNIDTPSPEMDDEQAAKLDRDNIAALRKTINKTGINQSLLMQSSTSTNFTSTSFAIPINMQGVVISSGGFFRITFKSAVHVPATQAMTLKLFIDGTQEINLKDSVVISSSSSIDVIAFLEWQGNLGEGRHNIIIQAAMSGGTGIFSRSDTYSTLQAIETLL